jgi:hypothetical protein
VPEGDKGPGVDVSIRYRDGIDDVLPEELRLIEAHLPDLIRSMLQDLGFEEERRK